MQDASALLIQKNFQGHNVFLARIQASLLCFAALQTAFQTATLFEVDNDNE